MKDLEIALVISLIYEISYKGKKVNWDEDRERSCARIDLSEEKDQKMKLKSPARFSMAEMEIDKDEKAVTKVEVAFAKSKRERLWKKHRSK